MTAPLFIVPGLGDSGPQHWQTRLQAGRAGTLRLLDAPWQSPDLDRWVEALERRLDGEPAVILVTHSFGCLAAARLLQRGAPSVRAALLVAPADPSRFGLGAAFRHGTLEAPSVLVASENDPWCAPAEARRLAERWGSQHLSIGYCGHINVDSGHGHWAFGERLADTLARTYGRGVARRRRSVSPASRDTRFAA